MLAKRIEPVSAERGRVIDKQVVAQSFSRAAGSYDHVATVQRWIIARLLQSMESLDGVNRVLDIGCGTGQLMGRIQQQFQPRRVLGLDIAEGMTRAAAERTALPAICGDAEAMPLPDNAFDVLVSSFALQWCPDLQRVFAESHRVLEKSGRFYFTLPVEGTLAELKDGWYQADPDNTHVNDFYERDQIVSAARQAGFQRVSVRVITRQEFYPDVKSITHALKAMGAHNVTEGRARHVTGKQKIKALMAAYEAYRTEQGLPLTWQVAFGVLEK